MNDLQVMEFARYLSYLEPSPPITTELDQWGSSYKSQKMHVCDWLQHQAIESKGAYGKGVANSSARAMYNRLLNPGALIWIAEALGEKELILREAVKATIKAEKTDYRERCKAFRGVITWGRITTLFEDYEHWVYDPQILPLIVLDYKTNMPTIRDGQRKKYQQIIDREWSG